jgi:hypothetical protein
VKDKTPITTSIIPKSKNEYQKSASNIYVGEFKLA